MTELQMAWWYFQARLDLARNDERGVSAVEWLLVTLAGISLVGIAYAAVKAFIDRKSGELGGSP